MSSSPNQHKPLPKPLLTRFLNYIWTNKTPKNTLNQSFFIKPESLNKWRKLSFLYNFGLLSTAFFVAPKLSTPLKYLTIWGIFSNAVYFGLVLLNKNAPNKSFGWKFTYVLGELAFAVESLVFSFFFLIIFPWMLKTRVMSNFDIFSQICLHLFAPLTIWVETACNHLEFPKKHGIFLGILMILYSFNNHFWTKINNKPVYPHLDWKSNKSHLIGLVCIGLSFVAYWLGNFLYKKKKAQRPNSRLSDKKSNL